MTERKYYENDPVRILPFSEIDRSDIGIARYEPADAPGGGLCFGIRKRGIDEYSIGGPYKITYAFYSNEYRMWTYRMEDKDGTPVRWYWAQGMLRPYEEEELKEPEPDDLFGFLFS